jgi:hypothetical protein
VAHPFGTWGGPQPPAAPYPPPGAPLMPQPAATPHLSQAAAAAPYLHDAPHMRPPSGLFPGQPSRPVYRESFPVRSGPVFAGLAATVVWFALFGAIARDLASYAWWTIVAAIAAWVASILLAVFGDRGVAVGVALTSGVGLSIAMAFVAERWITTYNWPLW